MLKYITALISFSFLFILIPGCKSHKPLPKELNDSSYQNNSKSFKVVGDTLAYSQLINTAVILTNSSGVTDLWIAKTNELKNEKLLVLNNDEGVKSVVWSPNNRLVAFVVYNKEGHSPLTTTHVWVVKINGAGLREIILPSPNEKYSTFNPIWASDSNLIISTVILNEPGIQKFIYNYNLGKIKEFTSNTNKNRE